MNTNSSLFAGAIFAALTLLQPGCSTSTAQSNPSAQPVAAPAKPQAKTIAVQPAAPVANRLVIRADQGKLKIDKNIYGHFSEHLGRCIYEGIWVGEDSPIPNTRGIRNDVVAAFKQIKVPNLRWPGGCFADEYHWKDGIGPREKRPSIYNSHWGGVVENNHFGTHEFLDLCEQAGIEPVICGNVGSGTVQEMMEWIEYMTSDADSPMANLRRKNGREKPWKVRYFAVGNENWGCGGNMRPEYYADVYKRYNTFIKNYSGNNVYRIACGASSDDYKWTEVLMANAARNMNGLSLHHYSLPIQTWSGSKGSATQYGEDHWFSTLLATLRMEEMVQKHSAIMDKYDPQKKVGLIVDEWGAWYDVEPGTNPGFLYQQSTMRDALVAGINLNIFNNHAERVKMANIAQIINVLQSVILTDKEKMIVTPTFHVFEMFTPHHDATLLPSELKCAAYTFGSNSIPSLSASASKGKDGKITISLCNLNPNAAVELPCELQGAKVAKITGRVLTAETMQAHNTFDKLEAVKPAGFSDFQMNESGFTVKLPAKSVVVLSIE
jgi:alpha-N-arabinofuranosidase